MPEQEMRLDEQPTESNLSAENLSEDAAKKESKEEPKYNIDELKTGYDNWKNLEVFCRNFPEAGQEINKVINDYMSGKTTKREATAAIKEVKKETETKEEKKQEAVKDQSLEFMEKRIRDLEEQAITTEMDLTLKRMASKKEYGDEVLKKAKEIEKKVVELGLIPALQAKTMTIERAYELAWKEMNWDNQLTKGKNEVISEIESKRSVQGPQLSKTLSDHVVPPKPKSIREAFELSEKDLGLKFEDIKAAQKL